MEPNEPTQQQRYDSVQQKPARSSFVSHADVGNDFEDSLHKDDRGEQEGQRSHTQDGMTQEVKSANQVQQGNQHLKDPLLCSSTLECGDDVPNGSKDEQPADQQCDSQCSHK